MRLAFFDDADLCGKIRSPLSPQITGLNIFLQVICPG